MNIGLYFGTFNPIHVGHLIIANYMVEHTDVDQVWMVVTPQNPLKDPVETAPLAARMTPRLQAICSVQRSRPVRIPPCAW